ncbi:Nitrogen regulation protein NtrB [Candidatus Phaeomarinobacter ectocarpi]|uniref:histidine kinase n=1 Tax=Candidatus Phaeomarinibacter ectocarpi TaxID=1458461 RepID=X5MN85_9HYPH|nr:ATP-binding protein [Candidatus Phaeomarinobacter ectocarpi]CDO61070.1 Nitrogen regulation protein NtrB [Candidatus Phaeomarinobacter ectocarpi]
MAGQAAEFASSGLGLDGAGAFVLDALPHPVMKVGPDGMVAFVNAVGEQFFAAGSNIILGNPPSDLVAFGSPLVALINQVQATGASVTEYGVGIGGPRMGERDVDIQVAPIVEEPGAVVVMLQERTIAHKMDRQLTHRGAARSVTGMAAVLAHEIKNPLSGIRGSAQLLEMGAQPEDRHLTRLITEEVDRICKLVDSMEVFSDKRPLAAEPVNIHEVLDHVRRLAGTGVAKDIKLTEEYDPSLPPVPGSRDQLVQVFLNLVKNAAEAVDPEDGEIVVSTAYRPGVRLSIPGSSERVSLPLEVCVRDNGPGVPPDLLPHLFDPFVTTKPTGTGLGLALVAKIVGDHGGVIECDSIPRRTVFRVLLPIKRAAMKDPSLGANSDVPVSGGLGESDAQ